MTIEIRRPPNYVNKLHVTKASATVEFYMAEVRVFSDSVNLVPASSISILTRHTGYPIENCRDNNLQTFCASKVNPPSIDQWFEVEFASPVLLSDIDRVEIINRDDCCRDELDGMHIDFFDPDNQLVKTVNPEYEAPDKLILSWDGKRLALIVEQFKRSLQLHHKLTLKKLCARNFVIRTDAYNGHGTPVARWL